MKTIIWTTLSALLLIGCNSKKNNENVHVQLSDENAIEQLNEIKQSPDQIFFDVKGPVKTIQEMYINKLKPDGSVYTFDEKGNCINLPNEYIRKDNRITGYSYTESFGEISEKYEYNDKGLIHTSIKQAIGNTTSTFEYDSNGMLILESCITEGSDEGEDYRYDEKYTYKYITFDEYGNWTERERTCSYVGDTGGYNNVGDTEIQKRIITYHNISSDNPNSIDSINQSKSEKITELKVLYKNRLNNIPTSNDYFNEMIDMGIPDDDGHIIFWAKSNLVRNDSIIEISKNHDIAKYFAWGDITGFAKSDEIESIWEYKPNIISGCEKFDIATAILGQGYRLPTSSELKRLLLNCTIEYKELYIEPTDKVDDFGVPLWAKGQWQYTNQNTALVLTIDKYNITASTVYHSKPEIFYQGYYAYDPNEKIITYGDDKIYVDFENRCLIDYISRNKMYKVADESSDNNVCGYLFTSKINNNQLFFPTTPKMISATTKDNNAIISFSSQQDVRIWLGEIDEDHPTCALQMFIERNGKAGICFEDISSNYASIRPIYISNKYIDEEIQIIENQDHTGEVFTAVEQMPQFPGGDDALMEYIQNNLQYPQSAKDNGIQCRVVVQFVVYKDGSIGEVKVVRSCDPDLDKEAIRVTKSLPNFIPGKMNGKVVNVWYTLPISFKLQGI